MKKVKNSINKYDKLLQLKETTEKLISPLSFTLIFLVSFVYFYLFREGVFSYQENKSLFIFSNEYFQKFLNRPGGLLEYAGNFLDQFNFYISIGSLINSVLIIVFYFVLNKITRKLSEGTFSLFLVLLPVCLMFFSQTYYFNPAFISLGYLILVLYYMVSIYWNEKRKYYLILILFPVYYYITGSFALIYLISFLIYSLIYGNKPQKYILQLIFIAIALITLMIFKEIIFLQSGRQLLNYPLPLLQLMKSPPIYSILCGYIISLPLLVRLIGLQKVNIKYRGFINIATFVTIFPITVLFLIKYYDPNLSTYFKIEKSAFDQDWDTVIKLQEKSFSNNSNSQFYYNLALSEKDQLCNRMFFGPQNFGSKTLFLKRDLDNLDKALYFYYSIGLVCEAHHLAYESMVVNGFRPENIKMLIKTELIDGNYKIAEQYIKILKKTLNYKKWALKYEKMLYNPQSINDDPELSTKIRSLPDKDFFSSPNDLINIDILLTLNPGNRRAFEYKLAWLLLEKDLKGVANMIKKMKGMGYTYIPRHVEEAIVEYNYLTLDFPDLGGLTINPDTEIRWSRFLNLSSLYGSNQQVRAEVLKKEGVNTYWFYYHFK